jgi:Mg2+ and Co2+ transporter CorA
MLDMGDSEWPKADRVPAESLEVAYGVIDDEIEKLKQQAQELEQRLAEIRDKLAALRDAESLIRDWLQEVPKAAIEASKDTVAEPYSELGMTDRIREILKSSGYGMTPIQVRNQLVRTGFSLEGRSNPMAEIHTILRRLVVSGEATSYDHDGGTGYIDTAVAERKRRPKKSQAG